MKHGQRSVEKGCVGAVLMYSRAAVHTREMIIIMVPISRLAGAQQGVLSVGDPINFASEPRIPDGTPRQGG